jgi:hypothetical protein
VALDKVAGTHWAEKAEDLVISREWNAPQLGDAGALTEILATVKNAGKNRYIARGVAKGIAVIGPRGVPPAVAEVMMAVKQARELEDQRLLEQAPENNP